MYSTDQRKGKRVPQVTRGTHEAQPRLLDSIHACVPYASRRCTPNSTRTWTSGRGCVRVCACVRTACMHSRTWTRPKRANERTYTIEGGENRANIMGRMRLATRSRVVTLSSLSTSLYGCTMTSSVVLCYYISASVSSLHRLSQLLNLCGAS